MTPKAAVLSPETKTTQQQGGADVEISLLEALFGDRVELCVWRITEDTQCDETATHEITCPGCGHVQPVCDHHLADWHSVRRSEMVRCFPCGHVNFRSAFKALPIGRRA